MAESALTNLTGIGPATAAELERAGIRSVRGLAEASLEEIQTARGFGPARAAAARQAARDLVAPAAGVGDESEGSEKAEKTAAKKGGKRDKKKGRKKGKKKDKKKDKKMGKKKDKKKKKKKKDKGKKGKKKRKGKKKN